MDADFSQRVGAAGQGPVGRTFPWVAGTALSGSRVRFPDDFIGAPALLLIAYRRGAQADVDRWAAFVRREAPGLQGARGPGDPGAGLAAVPAA